MSDDLGALDRFFTSLQGAFFALHEVSARLLADFDCTVVERSLLEQLASGPAETVPRLAQARSVSRQAMQKTVDRLIARRWLGLTANPHHERSPLVTATAAGRRVFVEMRARQADAFARHKTPIARAELERAAATLDEFQQFLNARAWGPARARSRRPRPRST